MKSTFLSNRNGSPLGRIDVRDDAVQSLYTPSGSLLGRYDPHMGRDGITYDAHGNVTGFGNLLPTFVSNR
jgi:hypothetical protein